MSATEIIREIQRLPPEERRQVEAFFQQARRGEDPSWSQELTRRIDDARSGRALTSAEVRAVIEQARNSQ